MILFDGLTAEEVLQTIQQEEEKAEVLRIGLANHNHPLPRGAIDARGLLEMALQDCERIIDFWQQLLAERTE